MLPPRNGAKPGVSGQRSPAFRRPPRWHGFGMLAIFSWVFVTSLVAWSVLRLTVGIRVDEEHEYEGVDLHECGLEAYPESTVAE